MKRTDNIERTMRNLAELHQASSNVDGSARECIERVSENLRDWIGPSVPRVTAAHLLGVSRTTLDKWIGRGKIPVIKSESGRKEVSREALELLIEQVRARGYSDGETHHLASVLMPPGIDGHRTAERQSLAYHQLIAERLNEAIVESARQTVEERAQRGGIDPRLTDLWRDLLSRSLDEIKDVITADSETARELRAIAPFTGVLGQEERQRVLDEVR